ncbi:hypothetical protein ACF0H5_005341 [Mactra antiquata]
MALRLSQNVLFMGRNIKYCFRLIHRKSTIVSLPSKDKLPEKISCFRDDRVTQIIDVRTPAEFVEDHIPGAINLPVLNNDEGAIVGETYSRNHFQARKTGAAIISRHIAEHIDEYKDSEFSPLIYCWRGGQRSHSMALVLAQIGFMSCVLEGGYKCYRHTVVEELNSLPQKFEFKVISGMAGTGKTKILQYLGDHGHQIIDLEALAKHKGSVLGLWHGETQPSQKYFDSLLVDTLSKLSYDRPVWVESESVRIGNIYIHPNFFSSLQKANRYCINLPLDERVKHTISDYQNWIKNKDELKVIIQNLVRIRGQKQIDHWSKLIENNRWEEFVRSMLVEHYDPTYSASQKKNNHSGKDAVQLEILNLGEKSLHELMTILTK